MRTVSVTFMRDENGRLKTFIYQDSPEFRHDGDYADLAMHEVLQLLNHLGLKEGDAENFLQQVLKHKTVRRQFQLGPEQETQVRQQFFSGHW